VFFGDYKTTIFAVLKRKHILVLSPHMTTTKINVSREQKFQHILPLVMSIRHHHSPLKYAPTFIGLTLNYITRLLQVCYQIKIQMFII